MKRSPENRPPHPSVIVQFDRPERHYEPGEPLEVRYRMEGLGDEPVVALEHTVLWYTEGKGEEDLGVHAFERLEGDAARANATGGGTIGTQLPNSPLSYEGVIVKIRWCVRIRIFFPTPRDFVSEHVFEVGRLPPARLAAAGP